MKIARNSYIQPMTVTNGERRSKTTSAKLTYMHTSTKALWCFIMKIAIVIQHITINTKNIM